MKKLIYVIATLILLISCSIGQTEQLKESQGSLILQLEQSTSRTIHPNVEVTILSYEVKAIGPKADFFESTLTATTPNLTKNGLTTGTWTITVKGKNSAGIVIASDTKKVEIKENSTSSTSFNLSTLSGEGTFSIELNWPENIINQPIINASLITTEGSEKIIPFYIAGNMASFTTSNLNNGYYILILQLFDGTEYVWDMVEATRIIKDEVSSAEITLTADDLSANSLNTGSINIDGNVDTESAIDITFSGSSSILKMHESMEIIATASEVVDSYYWYLNGVLLENENSNKISINSYSCIDKNRLTLVVKRENVLSSKYIDFVIDFLNMQKTELVPVPSGKYIDYWSVEHTVPSFSIGKYEVTYELWYTVREWGIKNGYSIGGGKESDYMDLNAPPTSNKYNPASSMTWDSAVVWCNAYSEYSNLTPVYLDGKNNILKDISYYANGEWIYITPKIDPMANGFRLPTELEWEYTAKGGPKSKGYRYAGSNNADEVAWYDKHKREAVGLKKPNELGIYDMSGNMAEWCIDILDNDFDNSRISKGGDWGASSYQMHNLTPEGSDTIPPNASWVYNGFRVARSNIN